ncbi:acetyl-CoA C-acetyltransferase [Acanthopleuribacter pedis]|uniref:Acetyl-CoA C-acetyltransferase n=1 Tax=Acanthopleuribacter pedis TaxID=442870 RepID=A0A8J7U4S2_9BACT|nr:acetyl-CoA C-acetyltransferase [Acanthopleuribacter pedis]MBO1321753.1 acetyl-CoA C-acetyltransferase [Acanthopleuribacter pedis]
MTREVVIVSAVRTPIANFQGAYSSLSAVQLGTAAVKAAVERAGVDVAEIDEVIMGNVLPAGLGQNPARQVAIHAGLPESVGAFTVNKVCGSGLKSVMLAAQAIRAGDYDCAVAGGMESMTNAPYLLPKARQGMRMGHQQVVDSMINDGLWDIYNDFHMGITGEMVSEKYNVSRERMDEYALASQQKAVAAVEAGRFKEEITPVSVPQRKGDPVVVDTDESPRASSTYEKLAKMRPAFKKDGTVTAGNASSINDGAAALVVMAAEKAEALGLKPLAKIVDYTTSGLAPEWVMMTPVPATQKLFKKTGWAPGDVDLFEFNEAFAVQACAVVDELSVDPEKVNVNGGAVALGHPIGASGARILTTLIYALKQRDLKRGVASLCMGGGNGLAIGVELV